MYLCLGLSTGAIIKPSIKPIKPDYVALKKAESKMSADLWRPLAPGIKVCMQAVTSERG